MSNDLLGGFPLSTEPLVIVGTTMAPYKMEPRACWQAWLANAESLIESLPGVTVEFFAALQIDARGREVYAPLLERLDDLPGSQVWFFSLDTGAREISTYEVQTHICHGRNLVQDFAIRRDADWCFFLDSDVVPAPDVLSKLVEVKWPVIAGNVPWYTSQTLGAPRHDGTYTCEQLPQYPFPVAEHWASGSTLLVHRSALAQFRWLHDSTNALFDDEATCRLLHALGYSPRVRLDVVCQHLPATVRRVEDRGHDLTIFK